MDGNTLLAWYVIMGGRVEEETLWADVKSYVEFISSFCVLKTMFTNDLVGAILSLLSQTISDAIATASTDQNVSTFLDAICYCWPNHWRSDSATVPTAG